MRIKTITLSLIAVSSLLYISCGKQSTAETLAEEFINDYALAPEKMVAREFTRLDSTKYLNDSIIRSMQERGCELFKKDIPYPIKSSGRMLYFIRMKYLYGEDSLQNTFYMDEHLEHIVSFK